MHKCGHTTRKKKQMMQYFIRVKYRIHYYILFFKLPKKCTFPFKVLHEPFLLLPAQLQNIRIFNSNLFMWKEKLSLLLSRQPLSKNKAREHSDKSSRYLRMEHPDRTTLHDIHSKKHIYPLSEMKMKENNETKED